MGWFRRKPRIKWATELGDNKKVALVKATALASVTLRPFSTPDFEVEITSGPEVAWVNNTPVLEVNVSATRNGKPLDIDGHLRFVNPPVALRHGNRRPSEQHDVALMTIIGDAIRRQLR